MPYCYFQPNTLDPKNRAADCVIRSICHAFSLEWENAFDALVGYARKAHCMPNQKKSYEPFLKDRGWVYRSVKNHQLTVQVFSEHRKTPAICHVRCGYGTHMVAVSNGNYYDSWDSGSRKLYGYWEPLEQQGC